MDSLFALPATRSGAEASQNAPAAISESPRGTSEKLSGRVALSNRDRRKPYSVALARPSRVVVDVLQILIFSIVFDVGLVMVSSGSSAPMPDFGTAPLRLLSTGFGYLNFLVRSCREPFGGDQNASICLISKQSEQLRLFLVGFFKC